MRGSGRSRSTTCSSPERRNRRNGYRERTRDTRAGSVELKIPKLRQGSCFPEFLEPRRTAEKALTAVIQEASVQGGKFPKLGALMGMEANPADSSMFKPSPGRPR